jgi:hypothetical protein
VGRGDLASHCSDATMTLEVPDADGSFLSLGNWPLTSRSYPRVLQGHAEREGAGRWDREVVGTLPLRQWVVIVDRYWEGWSEQELA